MKSGILKFLAHYRALLLFFCGALILAGCAHQPTPAAYDPPGSFRG